MQRYFFCSFCLFLSLITISVNAQRLKKTNPNDPSGYRGRQIVVGRGGGVTGKSSAYYLLDNGDLFQKKSTDSTYQKIGTQTATNTKRAFDVLENKCKITTTTFNNPGNVYQFVELVTQRRFKTAHRVTWGAAKPMPPANYPKFYKSFMAMLPNQ
jgi:hypothetical protein